MSGERKDSEAGEGLSCRRCGCQHLRVVYVRPSGGSTMRQRECRNCGHRFRTYEVASGRDSHGREN